MDPAATLPPGHKPPHVAPFALANRTRRTQVLPADLLRDAARRLDTAASVMAIYCVISLIIRLTLVPRLTGVQGFPAAHVSVLAFMVAASTGVFWAARRSGWPPHILLGVGQGFEILMALGISLLEFLEPSWTPESMRGVPWAFAVILVLFPVLAPATFRRTMAVAVTAAAMGPLAYCIAGVLGGMNIPFHPGILIGVCIQYFMVAPLALAPASVISRLVVEIDEARVMGSYVLEDKLGEGGMGEVWRARHRMLSRPAAVKMIPRQAIGTGTADAPDLLQRFEREARATAALRSPHTVVLYDFGVTDEGVFYYVMELLDGMDLETLVEKSGPVPPARCIHLLRQACRSLEEAHVNGMVHRDIKPANIYSCRLGQEVDFVKVLDFGLVKVQAADGPANLTKAGLIAGTPAYMAPEQARGDTVDNRSDLYALGGVGYWLLTGQPVFPETNVIDVIIQHITTPPVPPSERVGRSISADLERVILACLEKEPGKRPQTARDLDRMLASCQDAAAWCEEDAMAWWEKEVRASAPTSHVVGAAASSGNG